MNKSKEGDYVQRELFPSEAGKPVKPEPPSILLPTFPKEMLPESKYHFEVLLAKRNAKITGGVDADKPPPKNDRSL